MLNHTIRTFAHYVHKIIHNNQKLETTEEWIRIMWHIYTTVYNSAVRNNDLLKCAGKWMKLEKRHSKRGNTDPQSKYVKYSLLSEYWE